MDEDSSHRQSSVTVTLTKCFLKLITFWKSTSISRFDLFTLSENDIIPVDDKDDGIDRDMLELRLVLIVEDKTDEEGSDEMMEVLDDSSLKKNSKLILNCS